MLPASLAPNPNQIIIALRSKRELNHLKPQDSESFLCNLIRASLVETKYLDHFNILNGPKLHKMDSFDLNIPCYNVVPSSKTDLELSFISFTRLSVYISKVLNAPVYLVMS
ncbi:hypothetical protein NL108_004806 [Boleophthalmus pectinirostris]|nr:hypothetical protein NL108_004806 [Boleophthalmus pectinirostris]